jgi:crotonobetainyl-CoA:carnitine CoA-transferase CaiB-like acyl-CoA transferase
MAKAGADVIKIEPPQGEPLRRRAPPGKSTTFPIAMLSSNKRAITLNLKHERGRALLFRMVECGARRARMDRARRVGRIVVPTTPLRIHGVDPVETLPSPKIGQHNREIYGDRLGLSAPEIAALEQYNVI